LYFIANNLPGAVTDDKCVIRSWNPTIYELERMEVPNKTIQTPSREEGEGATKEDNASIKRPGRKRRAPPKRQGI
jgi:hypothetical protein